MAYTAGWNVVAFEVPTAAKWNQLGANDDSFHDGTGIADGAITQIKLVNEICSVRMSGVQSSIADSSWTKITGFDTTDIDTNSLWDSTNKKIVIKKSGIYDVRYAVRVVSGGGAAVMSSRLKISGTSQPEVSTQPTNNAGTVSLYLSKSKYIPLIAGDYIELEVYADTAAGTSTANIGTLELKLVG